MRFKVVGAWLCGLSMVIARGRAGATELAFSAPPQCERVEGVREQIERLIERPLSEAHDADFEVNIARTAADRWRAIVRSKPRNADGKQSEREFTGKTCAEVSDAAAVAIAMTIEQRERDEVTEAPEDGAAQAKPADTAGPPPAVTPPPTKRQQPESARWHAIGGLHATLESGALPNLSPGAELDVSASIARFRATLLGTFLAPQTERLADGKGGEFQLALFGLLACGDRPLGPVIGRGCLGFELGQISAEGVGVANPRIGNGAWRAARADLGVGWLLTAGLWLNVRGALAVPWTRQTFVLNGNERIFRPESMSVRGLLGLELEI